MPNNDHNNFFNRSIASAFLNVSATVEAQRKLSLRGVIEVLPAKNALDFPRLRYTPKGFDDGRAPPMAMAG